MLLEGGASMIPRAADGVIVTFSFCFHSLLLTIDRDSGDGPFRHDDIGRDNGCNIGDGPVVPYTRYFRTRRIRSAPSSGVMSLGTKPSQVAR